jgi:hypothetical protein
MSRLKYDVQNLVVCKTQRQKESLPFRESTVDFCNPGGRGWRKIVLTGVCGGVDLS